MRRSAFRLLELGSLLVFQGLLSNDTALQRAGSEAIAELVSAGFAQPAPDETIRVYPQAAGTNSNHAAAWRPGIIYLRENPKSAFPRSVYLRHELFHEFSFRTCKQPLARWEQEAAAMQFSGEAATPSAEVSDSALARLQRAIAIDKPLDELNYETLRQLVAMHGWPTTSCEKNDRLSQLLTSSSALERLPFSYEVISILTGRSLAKSSEENSAAPPGSLLKLPFAASLQNVAIEELRPALAKSDTEWFVRQLDRVSFERLDSIFDNRSWHQMLQQASKSACLDSCRFLLGERNSDQDFPVLLTLTELGWLMRNSILALGAERLKFGKLTIAEGGTLQSASQSFKELLNELHALAKTGTASSASGAPLVGHLILSWPEDDPKYLAIFRQGGVRGSGLAEPASQVLKKLRKSLETRGEAVEVKLRRVSRVGDNPNSSCAEIPVSSRVRIGGRASVCGYWQVRAGRAVEWVPGLIFQDAEGVLLRTDAESYADGVLRGEADSLTGTPRAALRAVALWNGLHGKHRHAESQSLCDTSHCMIYRGSMSLPVLSRETTDEKLLALLDILTREKRSELWLQFSEGGVKDWKQSLAEPQLAFLLEEPAVLGLQRRRERDGAVVVDLIYANGSEAVACETFRKRLKLPACPEKIDFDQAKRQWIFFGIGRGHGKGLDVRWLLSPEASGKPASDILQGAYAR